MVISTLERIDTSAVYDLPRGLRYKPYIPTKRINTKKTSVGSFTQTANPLFIHGNEFLELSVDLVRKGVAAELDALYNLETNFIFRGIWQEEYIVQFSELNLEPKFGLFDVAIKLRIICSTSPFSPSCTTTTPAL